jgi:DNA-binding response OmpR family regulator
MKKITVIDDDVDLRDLLRRLLQFQGFEVTLFSSGNELLNDQSAVHALTCDLFIIDINLAGLSGLDLCRHLKSRKDTQTTPVMIISAHPELPALAKDVRADEALTKPFSRSDLMEKILRLISGSGPDSDQQLI